jgi:signal transduction histidine kinase
MSEQQTYIPDSLFDLLPSAMLLLDAENRILRINQKALEILGLPSVETNSPLSALPAYLAPLINMLKNQPNDVRRGELTLMLPVALSSESTPSESVGGDDEAVLGYSLKQLRLMDNQPGRLLIFSDITQVTKDHFALDKIKDELYQSRKLASLGTLVAGVAHEMNNPLTGISMSASLIRMNLERFRARLQELLRTQELPTRETRLAEIASTFESIEKVLQEVVKISAASEKSSFLVNELLAYSKPGHFTLTPLVLHDLIVDTVKAMKSHPQFSRMTLQIEGESTVRVAGDRIKLEQVFYNILKNASEATEGQGTIRIFYTERLGTENSGAKQRFIEVHLRDNGPGIDKNIIDRIFDPFFTTKSQGGVGLGLSISYRTVEQHGGLLSVSSATGEGAEHIVALPVYLPISPDLLESEAAQMLLTSPDRGAES